MNPTFVDLSGHGLKFNCGFDGEVSAPTICKDGKVVGVYIDDTTPHQGYWINLALKKYKLVIAGISMTTPHRRYTGALNAQEWYPYHSGTPMWAWGKLPKADAYIIQWRFPGFNGTRSPNWFQRHKLLRSVRKISPHALIIGY